MKSLKYSLPVYIILILLFAGCSNQYTEKDFLSKDDYYSTINEEINDRNTDINFMDGKNISSDSTYIKDDSVFWWHKYKETKNSFTPLSVINNIRMMFYVSQDPVIFNGNIQLKNDSTLEVNNAVFLRDTLRYQLTHLKLFNKPLSNVSSFSYDDRLEGMRQYAFAGIFAGGVLGYKAGGDASVRESNPGFGAVAGAILLGLGGVITGVIIGSPQNYLLKKDDSETLKFLKRFGIFTGITSSALYGGFSDKRYFTTTDKAQYTGGLYYLTNIYGMLKFRPQITYCIKGGNYNYNVNPQEGNLQYIEGGSSTLYLDMIETSMLLQFEPASTNSRFLKLIAGPCINFPVHSELDEYYIGPMDDVFEHSVKQFNAKPYLSLMYGLGIKWDPHFSTEILFDQGISNLGKAQMSDGTILTLQQNDFLVTTTFSL